MANSMYSLYTLVFSGIDAAKQPHKSHEPKYRTKYRHTFDTTFIKNVGVLGDTTTLHLFTSIYLWRCLSSSGGSCTADSMTRAIA